MNREYHARFKHERSKPNQAILDQGQKGMPNPCRCAWPSWNDRDGAGGSSHPQRRQIMGTTCGKDTTEDMPFGAWLVCWLPCNSRPPRPGGWRR